MVFAKCDKCGKLMFFADGTVIPKSIICEECLSSAEVNDNVILSENIKDIHKISMNKDCDDHVSDAVWYLCHESNRVWKKPTSFEGYPLDENGDIKGFTPVLKQLQNEVVKQGESYVLKVCNDLKIDTDILIKQDKEIKLLKMQRDNLEAILKGYNDEFLRLTKILKENGITIEECLLKALDSKEKM